MRSKLKFYYASGCVRSSSHGPQLSRDDDDIAVPTPFPQYTKFSKKFLNEYVMNIKCAVMLVSLS